MNSDSTSMTDKQSELVERVARAMLLAEHPTAGARVWEADPEAGRIWRTRALAAIEAIKGATHD